MKLFKDTGFSGESASMKGMVLISISILLFFVSWPGLGGFWPALLGALIPLFLLRELRENAEITGLAFQWFSFLAFFLMNCGALYFLFFIDDGLGIRLLSFLTPVVLNSLWMTFVFVAFDRYSKRFGWRWGSLFFIALWMSLEWIEHHWTLAFPWLSLGNVLGPHPDFAQWVAYTGVAGGTLWILVTNFMFYHGWRSKAHRFKVWVFSAIWVMAPSLWSFVEYGRPIKSGEAVAWTIFQPCLDNYSEKFEPDEYLTNIDEAFSHMASTSPSGGILVLPETFVYEPGSINESGDEIQLSGLWMHQLDRSDAVKSFKMKLNQSPYDGVISGAFLTRYFPPGVEAPAFARSVGNHNGRIIHYNAALVIDTSQTEFRVKGELVAGVERVPFAEYFPVLDDWAVDLGGIVGSLGQADSIAPVEIAGSIVGIEICYDSVFGWISRRLASGGAKVLVIITNDAWWGETPGHIQLLSFAQLRAIETGLPVVRAANNGISAFINPRGTIEKSLPWDEKSIISHKLRMADSETFYTRHGDWLYQSAAGLLILLAIGFVWQSRIHRVD